MCCNFFFVKIEILNLKNQIRYRFYLICIRYEPYVRVYTRVGRKTENIEYRIQTAKKKKL